MRITRLGQILDNIENVAEILKSEVSKKTEGLDDKVNVLKSEIEKTALSLKNYFIEVANSVKNEIDKKDLNSFKKDFDNIYTKVKTEVEQTYNTVKDEVEKQFKQESSNEVKDTQEFKPATNIRDDKDNFYVEIDVPGLTREDISIELDDKYLIISGERKFKEELSEKDYYKLQSFKGKFIRKLRLPINANLDKIEAKVTDGVLEIVIPKIEVTLKEDKKKVIIK